jgi:hypothetical protein
VAKPGRSSQLRNAVFGLIAYGLVCCGALLLAVWCTPRITAILDTSDPLSYAIGAALTGTIAGALAELVGVMGKVPPPWRRRWTVGVAIVMWLFAGWIAVNLSLHPPES